MTPPSKVAIRLTDDQRDILTRFTRTGTHSPRSLVRARILLLADADAILDRVKRVCERTSDSGH